MIGIRAEDKNVWERRAPLAPDHVAHLIERHGLRVAVEPSDLRAFAGREYVRAGAELASDLAACPVVFGVKEIPIEKLRPKTAYLFFSHVIKAQAYNMPMLRHVLDTGCTLIDYERITDDRGRRLIFFGRHAGYAGMIDALWALGRRLRAEGIATPFADVRLAHQYSNLDEACAHIARLGERIRHHGLPPEIDPVVVGFTGSGNVTGGAVEILRRLPYAEVTPEQLAGLFDDPDRPRNVVFRVDFDRARRFRHRDGKPFDSAELAEHPERYGNGLAADLERLTVLVHGAYWDPRQPKIVTRDDVRRLWSAGARPRLRVIADITCDIGGAIEPTVRATDPGDPVYVYDAAEDRAIPGVQGHGPVVLAVDNLPCELPIESSEHFGDSLLQFVPAIARCDWKADLDDLAVPAEIRRAVVAHRGKLAPDYAYLEPHLP